MSRSEFSMSRRQALPLFAASLALGTSGAASHERNRIQEEGKETPPQTGLPRVHYLEMVTPAAEAICEMYSSVHGVTFGTADENLGGARIAKLANDLTLAVRRPMHAGERPVVRPYVLVEDIEAAVADASKSGAEVLVPPMEIAGYGKCAIVYQGEIESGFWQK